MNWIKENKFLTGYIVVMLIGIGVLGFYLFSASGAYDDASDNYAKASTEFNRLRHDAPYPDKKNLQAYEQQKEDAGKVVTDFEVDLTKKELPLVSMSPVDFQDKLKETVTAVRAKAADSGIQLGQKSEKFFLDFDKYDTTPPSNESAGPLGRQLKAMEWVVNQYLSHPASTMQAILSVKRMDLPEETGKGGRGGRSGGPGGASPGPGGPGRGPGPTTGGGSGRRSGLVHYHPFIITVTCKQSAMMDVINTVTGNKAPQFYVLRTIEFKNTAEKGPPKAGPEAKDKDHEGPQYIVGEEWLHVTCRWEIVDFVSPAEIASSEGPGAGAKPAPGGGRPTPAPKNTPAPAPQP
jgi:hypothetical protein